MGRSCSCSCSCTCFRLIYAILFQLVFVKSHAPNADEFAVPPLDVSQEAMLQHLKLGNDVKFNVPAMFVFGDSVLDSGNNNDLSINSKANFYPFGVDFGVKPTGRFSNGRNEADFIAQVTGLPLPPAYLGLSKEEKKTTVTGMNYASSSCGILPKTGLYFGKCLPLDKQIDFFAKTLKDLKRQFRNKTSKADYTSKSLFLINAGSADTGYAFDGLHYRMNETYTYLEYVNFVSVEFSQKLTKLYRLGARKFVINNIGASGCIPYIINTKKPETLCDEATNERSILFNERLSKMLPHLQEILPGSSFVIADVYKVMLDAVTNPSFYGITNTRSSCCIDMAGNGTLPCMPGKEPCSKRNEYVFFDPFHASEKTHFLFASRCFKDSTICHPITLTQLLQA